MILAREDLGTKRVCPETHKKFYDLGKDPIVSPYTGKEYPRSFFEEVAPVKVRREAARPVADEEENEVEAEEEEDEELEEEGRPEFVSLEDAEEDEDTEKTVASDDEEEDEGLPDIPDVDIEVDEDEDAADDAFLEEEEEDDDLSDVIGDVDGEEEV